MKNRRNQLSPTGSGTEKSKGHIIRHQTAAESDLPDTFRIEVFIDLPNINNSLKSAKCHRADFGKLVTFTIDKFVKRLGMRKHNTHSSRAAVTREMRNGTPVVIHSVVWCFVSIATNFHPDDAKKISDYRRFLTALRLRHGFHVEEIPNNFCGYHLRNRDRRNTGISDEQAWIQREKGLDVGLAVRLTRRCISSNPPDGVILMSGDGDYAPALNEISRHNPRISVMVAAFSDAISHVYHPKKSHGYTWRWSPIILDGCIPSLKSSSDSSLTNRRIFEILKPN